MEVVLAEFQMIPSSACCWKCLLQPAASSWRPRSWCGSSVLPPSLLWAASLLPLLIWVWEWIGEAWLLPRKNPRLNNGNSAVAPASSWPVLFPECSHRPRPPRRSPHSQAGLLGPCFSIPTCSIQVCKDHSLTYLCLLSSKGAPELWEEASLFLKKRKRDRKNNHLLYL